MQLDPIRDYIVSTTYRKEEQEGEKWSRPPARSSVVASAPGRETSRAVREVCRLEAPWCDLRTIWKLGDPNWNAAEALAGLLWFVGGKIRWEPLNGGSLHRTSPSGGGRFGTGLYVLGRRGGVPAAWRWQDGGLIDLLVRPPSDLLPPSDCVSILLMSDLGRLTREYGAFSACLSSLDCGFMLHQILLAASVAGFPASVDVSLGGERVVAGLGLQIDQMPLAMITIEKAGDALDRYPSRSWACPEPPTPLLPDALQRLLGARSTECSQARSDRVGARWIGGGSVLDDLIADSHHRTSGLSMGARPPGRFGIEDLHRLMLIWKRMPVFSGAMGLERHGIAVAFQLSDASDDASSVYRCSAGHGMSISDLEVCAHRAKSSADAPSPALLVTLGCDDLAEGRVTAGSTIRSHIAVGMVAQSLSLAVTRAGLCARPLKSYADQVADEVFDLSTRAVLQLWCDHPRQANPKLALIG
jgi:hypothetical protein